MSVSELGTAMTEMGYSRTDDELKAMIAKYDLDANGQINYREFHTMMGWTDPVPATAPPARTKPTTAPVTPAPTPAPAPAPIGGNTPTPTTDPVQPAPAPAPIGGNTPTPTTDPVVKPAPAPAPIGANTTTPTTDPVKTGGTDCVDKPWVNNQGHDCAILSTDPHAKGDWIDTKGVRADEACCKFGGGTKGT